MAKLKPLTKAEQKTLASLEKRQYGEVATPKPHVPISSSGAMHAELAKELMEEVCSKVNIESQIPLPAPDSVAATLDERGERYGDFTDHARLAQQLQDALRFHWQTSKDWKGDPVDVKPWDWLNQVQKQALAVVCDKLARILNGDPNYADNWHDIQGYAKLVEDRLPK